jgi:hypothetical protein
MVLGAAVEQHEVVGPSEEHHGRGRRRSCGAVVAVAARRGESYA